MNNTTQRKWEFIINELIKFKAPKKVVNAAREIDRIMIEAGLGWNTDKWIMRERKWQSRGGVGTIYILKMVMASMDSAACADAKYDCGKCKIGKFVNYHGHTRLYSECTPRSKYPDNYQGIVIRWMNKIIFS